VWGLTAVRSSFSATTLPCARAIALTVPGSKGTLEGDRAGVVGVTRLCAQGFVVEEELDFFGVGVDFDVFGVGELVALEEIRGRPVERSRGWPKRVVGSSGGCWGRLWRPGYSRWVRRSQGSTLAAAGPPALGGLCEPWGGRRIRPTRTGARGSGAGGGMW